MRIVISIIIFALISLWHVTPAIAAEAIPPYQNAFLTRLKQGQLGFQLGGFIMSSQGQSQHINIRSLIGDNYTANDSQNKNVLVGVSYFLDGTEYRNIHFLYGINAFYFFKTSVNGTIAQENLFTNLGYSYDINHVPVYLAAKALFPLKDNRYHITMDLGIGPNFAITSSYHEKSLDGVTIPDRAFSGRTTTNFSVTVGLGVKIDHVLGQRPIECGYRFFRLGPGSFNKENSQILTTLKTGQNYASAISCGVDF